MSSAPARVSVCLPNLNARPFLAERFASLQAQTMTAWEAVVYDSFSDDGSWELICQAARDPRLAIFQGPREGVYQAWNFCLRRARAEFVYIAPSDDTMAPRCLERLLEAFARHPEADVVSSLPWMIDEYGREIEAGVMGDIEARLAAASTEPRLMDMRELALAALRRDRTPALSVTQLLVRRNLFERLGFFPEEFGSMGDWAWQMLAVARTRWAFVPDKLGAWRRYQAQATAGAMADQVRMRRTEAAMGHWLADRNAFNHDLGLRFELGRFIAARNGSAPRAGIACYAGYLAGRLLAPMIAVR